MSDKDEQATPHVEDVECGECGGVMLPNYHHGDGERWTCAECGCSAVMTWEVR